MSKFPAVEPGMFRGDPLTFPSWKVAFSILMSRASLPDSERLHSSGKYLDGEAMQVVESFFLVANSGAISPRLWLC